MKTSSISEGSILRAATHSSNSYAGEVYLNATILGFSSGLGLRQKKELQRFIEMAESNISRRDFGVSQMADQLALTERTLHRKLKSLTGLSPVEFIREVKLYHAKKMCDGMQVHNTKELAYKLGYINAGYLNKLYKNRFGEKPFQE